MREYADYYRTGALKKLEMMKNRRRFQCHLR